MEPARQHQPISILDPLSEAWARTQLLLFEPFRFGKWLAVAFCAWLAFLGQGGGGGASVNFNKRHGTGEQSADQIKRQLEQWLRDNIDWLIPAMIAAVVAGVVLWLLILWLSSRGRFMFLNCVARNTGDVAAPWREFAPQGNSLFRFRLCLTILGSLAALPIVLVVILLMIRLFAGLNAHNFEALVNQLAGRLDATIVLPLLGCILGGAAIVLLFTIVGKLTHDLVEPIMYRRRITTLAAWNELRAMMRGRLGAMILYLLFQLLLQIVLGAIAFFSIFLTCCIVAIPYVGTVILLPLFVFERAYSVCFLEQFGEEWRVME